MHLIMAFLEQVTKGRWYEDLWYEDTTLSLFSGYNRNLIPILMMVILYNNLKKHFQISATN